ncbi:Thioredoxin, partial [Sphaerulina musiva]
MTILKSFPLPSSPSALQIPNEKERDSPPSNFFIAFLASKDPLTNQPWCPDVRAALPILEATFQEPTTSQGAEGEKEGNKEGNKESTTPPPVVAFIEVGQKTEWKNPHNVFRTQWNIHNVPVLVRYELVAVAVEGNTTTTKQVKEVGRLVEGEILDERRLQELV